MNMTLRTIAHVLIASASLPTIADFQVSGGVFLFATDGSYSIVSSDVPDPHGFSLTGSTPADDHNVNIHLDAHYSDPWLTTSADLYLHTDLATGELGVFMGGHTSVAGPARSGPAGGGADVWMWDIFHIDPGPGYSVGDPVEIRIMADWSGHILMEGVPNSGSYAEYRAKFFTGSGGWYGGLLGGLSSVTNNIYPPMDEIVDRTLNELVSVHVGDAISVYQYISLDLNGSGYSDDAGIPEGYNYLDFDDSGWAGIGYAPGYEGLNIWSEAGALPVPEPSTAIMFGLGLLAILGTGYARGARPRHHP